jgi:hypothetical protein
MYSTAMLLHSWLRWAVILLGLWAVLQAATGLGTRRPWGPADARAGRLFVVALDVQLLLGLLLYFALSPITRAALADFGAAMSVSAMRFWAVEHVFGMVVALALAHRGVARARSVLEPASKHRVALVFFGLALVAILAAIPWPGTPNARPLFRW